MKYGKREQSSPETAAGPHPHPLELEMWSFCWIVVVVRVNINIIRRAFRWQTLAPLRAYVRLSFGMRRQGRRLLLLLRCNKPVEAKKRPAPASLITGRPQISIPISVILKRIWVSKGQFQKSIPGRQNPGVCKDAEKTFGISVFFMNPPDRKRTVCSW